MRSRACPPFYTQSQVIGAQGAALDGAISQTLTSLAHTDHTFPARIVLLYPQVMQEIKVLRSTVLSRDKERAERATLVVQEKLVRGKVR